MTCLQLRMVSRSTAWNAFLFAMALLAGSRTAPGAGPADPLLRLVPADAGATLVVEDLKGTARDVLQSSLFEGVCQLPVVREWLESGRFREVHDALGKVDQALGEKVHVIRDDLFGEAFILTLHVPKGGRPDEARGLLLVRVPNRELLDRLVLRINTAQSDKGELRRVVDRTNHGVSYHVREFPPGGREAEYYATLNDRVFVWSNSESLIHGAIDRQAGTRQGLAEEPAFRAVREGLPGRSIATLYVDPRFVGKVLEASAGTPKPEDERLLAFAGRYLKAVRYAGASVVWRQGVILQTREVFDPEKLTPGMKQWASRRETPDAVLNRFPATALIAARAAIDPVTLIDTLSSLVAAGDRPKLAILMEALKGVMLAQSVREDVAPHLGPGMVASIERPDPNEPEAKLPIVFALEIARSPAGAKAGAAVANGLRTILAVHALDPKNGATNARIITRSAPGSEVVALSDKTPYAFALADGRMVVGNSLGAVTRALVAHSNPTSISNFAKFRDELFPNATNHIAADLKAIHEFASRARPVLARRLSQRQGIPLSDAGLDLDRALALVELFDVAFVASTIEPGFLAVNRTMGLVRLATASRP